MDNDSYKDDATHFGYQHVPRQEKAKKVAEVFHSVAEKYDVMNDIMSLGIHRLWKKIALQLCPLRPGQRALDLASGSGDLAFDLSRRVGDEGLVVLSDINDSMLSVAKERLLDKGIYQNVQFVQADAEELPFPNNHFHCITMAFGLRNVTNKDKALKAIYDTLKPGGQALILEFSTPNLPGLKPIYDVYSFSILPKLGQWIAGDAESYRYLAESIRMHPDQETMLEMMQAAGFEDCTYHNLSGGIVAIHRGYKY